MNKNMKICLVIASLFLVLLAGFALVKYHNNNKAIDNTNMCQDDALIFKLIDDNVNPFTKFKFIKKRNEDCKSLLRINREDALKYQKEQFCSYLDSSTNSLTVLINAYVHEMYDRESASKAFHDMTPLMTPYEYCPQYINDMITLIKIKKRLGL